MYHKWGQAPFKNNNEVEFLGYMLQVAWIKMFKGFAHVARRYIYLQHGGTLSLLPLCLRCFTLFLNCVQCLTLIFTQFVFHDFSFFLTSRLNIPFSSHFYNDSTFCVSSYLNRLHRETHLQQILDETFFINKPVFKLFSPETISLKLWLYCDFNTVDN